MKFLLTIFIFLLTPVIFCLVLLYAIFPLFFQHFFRPKAINKSKVYPYQTSWEEVA